LKNQKGNWQDKVATVRALKAQQEALKVAHGDQKVELENARHARVKQHYKDMSSLVGESLRLRQSINYQRRAGMAFQQKQTYNAKMEREMAQTIEAEKARQEMLEARRVGPPMLREARDRAQLQASRMRRIQEHHREELRQQWESPAAVSAPQAMLRPRSAGVSRAIGASHPHRQRQVRPASARGQSRRGVEADEHPEPEAECTLAPNAPPPTCIPWPAAIHVGAFGSFGTTSAVVAHATEQVVNAAAMSESTQAKLQELEEEQRMSCTASATSYLSTVPSSAVSNLEVNLQMPEKEDIPQGSTFVELQKKVSIAQAEDIPQGSTFVELQKKVSIAQAEDIPQGSTFVALQQKVIDAQSEDGSRGQASATLQLKSANVQPQDNKALPNGWAAAGSAFDELQAWAMTSNDGSESLSAS